MRDTLVKERGEGKELKIKHEATLSDSGKNPERVSRFGNRERCLRSTGDDYGGREEIFCR